MLEDCSSLLTIFPEIWLTNLRRAHLSAHTSTSVKSLFMYSRMEEILQQLVAITERKVEIVPHDSIGPIYEEKQEIRRYVTC